MSMHLVFLTFRVNLFAVIFIAPGPPRFAFATCGARSVITVTRKNVIKLALPCQP